MQSLTPQLQPLERWNRFEQDSLFCFKRKDSFVQKIEKCAVNLERYIITEAYCGYDPFDALTSPLFRLPFFRSNRLLRFAAQQVVKRNPINLRRLLGVRKGLNPVTLGLCLQAYSYLQRIFPQKREHYSKEIDLCLDHLEALQSKGYSGACWGYDFDWEARYAKIPAFTPMVVATGFITNALFEYFRLTNNDRAFALCKTAAQFVRNDLQRTFSGKKFCYSYSPVDKQVVFNASMKGARLLMQVYSETGDDSLYDEAACAVAFVMDHQTDDGCWAYAHGDARKWVDNFHTAYILDCLDAFIAFSDDTTYLPHREKALRYYLDNFFEPDGAPRYYDRSQCPVDATAAAQSILTLTRVGEKELAAKVAWWMINNMLDEDGFFYYRKHRFIINKISYMRWSNAWMFLALAYLLSRLCQEESDRS